MKILITVNAAWNVWNFRRPLVEALVAQGHQVTVLAPQDDSVTQIESLGCSFQPLQMGVKGLNPLQDFGLMLRFRRIFRAIRPDVILSFTIKNNIFGALAAKFVGVPFLPNVTGLGTAFLSGGALEKVAVMLYRTAFRGLPVVLFQNEDDRSLFMNRQLVSDKQARLVPGSGIDLDRFAATAYPDLGSTPVFLMIARLLRDKGVLDYVEAARRVKSRYPRLRFQILGATDAQNRTAIDRKTVQQWVDEGLIEYLGVTDDVRPFIAMAHCVVLPSYREGAPRTLIEAAAMARPLIATDVPGCKAVLEDGKTGFLCAVRDPGSLASACERLLTLTDGAKIAMGLAGRAKMEREFDQRIVIAAYLSAIDTLTNQTPLYVAPSS